MQQKLLQLYTAANAQIDSGNYDALFELCDFVQYNAASLTDTALNADVHDLLCYYCKDHIAELLLL